MWELIQTQILGMQWLNDAVGEGLAALGVDLESRMGGSLHFFFTMC